MNSTPDMKCSGMQNNSSTFNYTVKEIAKAKNASKTHKRQVRTLQMHRVFLLRSHDPEVARTRRRLSLVRKAVR